MTRIRLETLLNLSMCNVFKDYLDFSVLPYGLGYRRYSTQRMAGHLSMRALPLSTILHPFVRGKSQLRDEHENSNLTPHKSLTIIP